MLVDFDPVNCVRFDEDISVSFKDNLPHMHQEGKYQYITFRLADSLPQSKCGELKDLIANFLELNPKPWSRETFSNYCRMVGSEENRLLDKGYGECILRNHRVRQIVTDAIDHIDGIRYETLAYVVMPNHVHWLLRCFEGFAISDIVYSLKRFSSTRINRLLGRDGAIWMKRYFDRMPRGEHDFEHFVKYIAANPGKLPPEDYSLYIKK